MTPPRPPGAAELKRLCAARGIRPNRGRGQNFMVNPHLLRLLVQTAAVTPADVILEPGPGPGGLTQLLAAHAARVIAVELDAKLHALLAEQLAHTPNLQLLHADILAPNGNLNPAAMTAVKHALAQSPDRAFKIVANLPYRVSTAFITAALAAEPPPETIVVTVQKEVADRLTAAPGTSDYGYLTVIVQTLARVLPIRNIPPRAFWPQPEIHSTLIKITPHSPRRNNPADLAALRKIAGALFTHRRKQAARTLLTAGLAPNRAAAEQLLARVGADPAARPENLSVQQFIALAQHVT